MSESGITVVSRKIRIDPGESNDFERAFLDGMRCDPRYVPCKYFYDARGSALFEEICELAEYYLTRTELSILARHAGEIGALIGPKAELVEFGAGDSRKARLLLDALVEPRAYRPFDISGEHLQLTAALLGADYPKLVIEPIVADFTKPFGLPPLTTTGRRVGFFPGSTIGNLRPSDAHALLSRLAPMLRGGGLLIGVDLVKDPLILHAAYNDADGITEKFNKNILVRANRSLGANFDLNKFSHYAFYNPPRRRMEMYLVSLAAQHVTVAGTELSFADGDAIHTEDSLKYTVEDFQSLASAAGFVPNSVWSDENRLFSVHWLESR